MPSPHPGGPRRTLMTGLVVVLTATPGLVACTGEEPRSEGPGPAASSRPGTGGEPRPARRVRTDVAVGEVVGALGPVKRRRVATGVGRAVDRWWDAAFVDATYPRRRYRSVFPGFTPGAAQAARRDLDRMTSHRLGERIDALTPVRRRVVVDILATQETARGVTARTTLDYRTSGEVERRVRVSARLFMLYREGWRIFGYDVLQGPKPTSGPRGGKARQRGRDRSRS